MVNTFVMNVLTDRAGDVPEDDAVGAAVDLLRRHRLEGLAYTWAKRRGTGSSAFAKAIEPTYRQQQLAGAILQESAGRVLELLAAADIPALVFKGAGLIRAGLYQDVGERPMDDIDVIVKPEDAERAAQVLGESGFAAWGKWRPGRERWSDTFTLRDEGAPAEFPTDVDLHWRTEYGSLRFGSGGSALWSLPASDRRTPAPQAHLVVVAEHFLKHLRVRPHLLAYADLHRLSAAVAERGYESWKYFVGLARSRWWSPATGLLLDVLRVDLDAPVPDWVCESLITERSGVQRFREALKPATHLRGGSGRTRIKGVGRRWQLGPGPTGVARDLFGAVFPPQAWLEARYGGGSVTGLRLQHGTAVLRWVVGQGASPLSPNQEAPKALGSRDLGAAPDPVDTPMGRL